MCIRDRFLDALAEIVREHPELRAGTETASTETASSETAGA